MTTMTSLVLYAPPSQQVSVLKVKGVGPALAEELASSRFNISSVQDLLLHYPRRHLDFSDTKAIHETRAGDEVTIIGTITKVGKPPPRGKRWPLKVVLDDGRSRITLAFFNQPWRSQQLKVGTKVAAKGKVGSYGGARQMTAPMIDVISEAGEAVKIVPVYPATAEIQTTVLRRIIRDALQAFSPIADPIDTEVLLELGLIDRTSAMKRFHFPKTMAERARARERLVFDELFTLQVGLAFRKRRIERETIGITHKVEAELAGQFVEALPFDLTGAQRRSVAEVEQDMGRSVPMHRLLQGEVGSGKTVVALYAALLAVQGGYQAAVMAPTEVLAGQHFLTMRGLLEPLTGGSTGRGQLDLFGGPQVVMLTGGMPAAAKRDAVSKIADGSASIVVGTHALIQEGVDFANLGLAIIDEQHRFGVHQRIALRDKTGGQLTPDVLIMTATPIPRTLALTLYGDLDVSVVDELPKGRKPITTTVLDGDSREKAYEIVRQQVAQGRQAYVIVPLVEESDKLEVKSAMAEAERIKKEVFPQMRVGMMHGRLGTKAKDAVMDEFRRGDIDVLVSTTVVEVGVDVPNATVMLIEDADRFGLSQLHQLRGRIGRGEHPSSCILLTSVSSDDPERKSAVERLRIMETTTDGFELASKDLELRGTGTLMGSRQAGFSDLRLTHLVHDIKILKMARDLAFSIIDSDPELDRHPLIRTEMEGRFADRLDWLFYS